MENQKEAHKQESLPSNILRTSPDSGVVPPPALRISPGLLSEQGIVEPENVQAETSSSNTSPAVRSQAPRTYPSSVSRPSALISSSSFPAQPGMTIPDSHQLEQQSNTMSTEFVEVQPSVSSPGFPPSPVSPGQPSTPSRSCTHTLPSSVHPFCRPFQQDVMLTGRYQLVQQTNAMSTGFAGSQSPVTSPGLLPSPVSPGEHSAPSCSYTHSLPFSALTFRPLADGYQMQPQADTMSNGSIESQSPVTTSSYPPSPISPGQPSATNWGHTYPLSSSALSFGHQPQTGVITVVGTEYMADQPSGGNFDHSVPLPSLASPSNDQQLGMMVPDGFQDGQLASNESIAFVGEQVPEAERAPPLVVRRVQRTEAERKCRQQIDTVDKFIIWYLRKEPMSYSRITELTGFGKGTINRALGELKDLRLPRMELAIETQEEGTRVFVLTIDM
ncbi:MAG: hypothetical protein J3Q66DRAFT_445017 [Benniella sp.]|nr:MAG: hypothetical protein J3Q66DRAFT_445017 [Benniella sp.]